MQESCVAHRQFLNLVTWDVSKFDSMLSRWSPTKTVPRDPRGLQCRSPPCPYPLSSPKLKKAIKLPSNRHLPTPNISFPPFSLQFRPDFPLLLTFSGHFFLPSLFLSPQNKGGVGGRLGHFVREICFTSLINYDCYFLGVHMRLLIRCEICFILGLFANYFSSNIT